MKFPPLAPPGGSGGPLYLTGWDLAVLGGFKLPGKSKISGGKVKLKKDPKSKAGADGAKRTYHGIEPQEFQIEIECWTDDQIALAGDICRQLVPQPGSTPTPMSLVHPSVQDLAAIVNVVVLGASQWEQVGETCRRKRTIYLDHWLPPTAKGAKATTTPGHAIRNKQRDDAAKRVPQNPPPSTLPGAHAPPPSLAAVLP